MSSLLTLSTLSSRVRRQEGAGEVGISSLSRGRRSVNYFTRQFFEAQCDEVAHILAAFAFRYARGFGAGDEVHYLELV